MTLWCGLQRILSLVKSEKMKRYSSFLTLVVLAALLGFAGPQAAAAAEADTLILDDVPLMPGLSVVDDNLIVLFGPAHGPDLVAEGMIDIDDVYTYYQTLLPQRGWSRENGRTFDKGNDRLVIDAKSSNNRGITIVHFIKTPLN